MRIVVDIGHPAHVHYFRNLILEMRARGHEFLVFARERDEIRPLLQAYDIPFVSRGRGGDGLLGKLAYLPKADHILFWRSRAFRPDLFLSLASPYAAHAAWLLGRPHIAFDDTEYVRLGQALYRPFSAAVVTPDCYREEIGPKQIRFPGFLELAYLGPERFAPDPAVLAELGVGEGEPYVVARFNAFKAIHDRNVSGFSPAGRLELVRRLSAHARVFVSAEGEVPEELFPLRLPTAPERIHHVLAHARLLVGESGTMATEAACLGTRAVRCDSFAHSDSERGNFIELEQRYGLMSSWNSTEQERAIDESVALMGDPDLGAAVASARQQLLRSSIEVTPFMIWLVERYPASVEELRVDASSSVRRFARTRGAESEGRAELAER